MQNKEARQMTTKEKLAERWRGNRISEAMLRIYVIKGIITDDDFKEITGNAFRRSAAARSAEAKQ
jgi:hypothetical protein